MQKPFPLHRTIADLIQDQLPVGAVFKPSKTIYKALGLNQKRFGMILTGKTDPTLSEVRRICAHFKIDIHKLVN